MAESCVITYDGNPDDLSGPQRIRTIIFTWTSAADGTCSGTTKKISGYLLRAITDPGAAAPAANYDIALTGGTDGVDLLGQCGDNLADRHTTTTEAVALILNDYGVPAGVGSHPVVNDTIQLEITNAGDSKNGIIYLVWTPG